MKNQPRFVYDLIGIGIGPFNLGLAALAHPMTEINTLFFERNNQFDWHPGLLIEDAHLQVPFLADLVTLADPTHPFSFLNYLHHHQRMYKFYFRENFHISRKEYNHYCQWVCSQLTNLHFSHVVTQVEQDEGNDGTLLRVTVKNLINNDETCYYTKHLAVGVGTEPYIPEKLRSVNSPYIRHTADFINFRAEFRQEKSICIVGSGQSAAEVVLELLNEYDSHPRQLTWVTRSPGFFPMEYSKLGLEHFSPEYTNYFYHLDKEAREKTLSQQDLMYKGISQKTIADIFDKVYQLTIANQDQPLTLLSHSDLDSIRKLENTDENRFSLHFKNKHLKKEFNLDCDAVILGVGYRAREYRFLQRLSEELISDTNQTYALNKDFSIKTKHGMENKIFLQNNSLFSHGVGSSDLGLGCYRNSMILNAIVKDQYYSIHNNNVFQAFSLPQKVRGIAHENECC